MNHESETRIAFLENQLQQCKNKLKQTKEKLLCLEQNFQIGQKRYEIVLRFSDITIFDYNIHTKQMIHHWHDIKKYGLPKVMDNAVDSLVHSGIIMPCSIDAFCDLYHKVESGEAYAKAEIRLLEPNGLESIAEIQLATIYDSQGKPMRVIGSKKDITDTILLKREKEYGHSLTLGKVLSYEANVTLDKITAFDEQWRGKLGLEDMDVPPSMTQMLDMMCNTVIFEEDRKLFIENLSKKAIMETLQKGKKTLSCEYRKAVDTDVYEWFEKTVNIIQDKSTGEVNIRCYVENINARKEREARLLAEKQHYEAMLSKSAIVYEVNVKKNIFLSGHEIWGELFGIEQTSNYSEMMEALVQKALHPDDREAFCNMFLRKNVLEAYAKGKRELVCEYRRPDATGAFIWVCCTMHLFEDPMTSDVRGFSYVENIDDEKRKELQLIYKSQRDLMTGFFNKTTIEEKIDEFLDTCEGRSGRHAFLIIDLDNFKAINDNFGHAFGDAVLSQASAKIAALFREDDLLGRIGGDEFVILMKNIPHSKAVCARAEAVCATTMETYTQNGQEFHISASVGIAYYNPKGSANYKELYAHSDTALYYSKHHGRNKFSAYSPTMSATGTSIKDIDSDRLTEMKKFEENMSEYVFRILYESTDKKAAIYSVLELIGKYYRFNRVYIFEDSEQGSSNTFEWCSKGTSTKMDSLQNVSYPILYGGCLTFDEEGLFFLPDVQDAPPQLHSILKKQGIKSLLVIKMPKSENPFGLIGFEHDHLSHEFHAKELCNLSNISSILGMFIAEMRAMQKSEAASRMALSIVNGLGSCAYVCEPQSRRILFLNRHTTQLVPNAKIGECCHQAFWNKQEVCAVCPITQLMQSNETVSSIEVENSVFGEWVKVTASWIDWMDGEKACLVDISDISAYKE